MAYLESNAFYCGWQHESYRLVRGVKPAYDCKQMKMLCCKNDFAAASLVLQTDERYAIQLENHAEFYPQSWRFIKAEYCVLRVEAECEGISEISLSRVQMHPDIDGVDKGDALFDWGSELFEPHIPVQLFLRLNIPADAEAGKYSGAVRVYAHKMFDDEELVCTMPFEVEVAEVALPERENSRFFMNIWQHPANIARHHQVPLFSDEHFAVLEDYTRTLREMGNVVATVNVADIPWVGQNCYAEKNPYSDLFEYNIVRICKEKDGTFKYDFSILKRYLELCEKYDMAHEIQLFGLAYNWTNADQGYGNITEDYPDAIRLRYIDKADGCGKFMRKAEDIKAYIHALYCWLKDEGWFSRCVVAPDEPTDLEELKRSLAPVNDAAPNIKLCTDFDPFFLRDNPDLEYDSYVPLLNTIGNSEAKERGIIASAMARCKGARQWYTCCYPMSPNTFLCSPLLEGRLIALTTEFLKLDGFTRWAYTCWPVDPISNGKAMGWPTGDAFFVYPGKNGKPIYSLRYFALKRGIGDFELIQMVKEKCTDGEKLTDELLKPIFRQQDITKWNWDGADESQFSYDPADYEKLRAELIKAVLDADKN